MPSTGRHRAGSGGGHDWFFGGCGSSGLVTNYFAVYGKGATLERLLPGEQTCYWGSAKTLRVRAYGSTSQTWDVELKDRTDNVVIFTMSGNNDDYQEEHEADLANYTLPSGNRLELLRGFSGTGAVAGWLE